MTVLIVGGFAVLFLGLGIWFHDFQISRKWEIIFLCSALAAGMVFFWLLGQNLLKEIESLLRNSPRFS